MLGFFRAIRTQNIRTYSLLTTQNIFRYSSEEDSLSESSDDEIPGEVYAAKRRLEFKKLYSIDHKKRITGFATPEGTKKHFAKFNPFSKNIMRNPMNSHINVSNIGIGTYLGEIDEVDDLKMFNAIIDSVEIGGLNVIDTAINYRSQKSERVVGAALRYLIKKGASRDELFISSKNGYLTDDGDTGASSLELTSSLIEKGKLSEDDVIADYHCIHPAFLELQLEKTLSNIGIETLDLYYLHNVSESQLLLLSYQELLERLSKAFEFCEEKVQQGKIKSYGMATWTCFRSRPDQDKLYVGLQEVIDLAAKVGGKEHNFKYIQFPYNYSMLDSYFSEWQIYKENNKTTKYTIFELAEKLGVNIITSVPLGQGAMLQYSLSTEIFKASNRAVEHLQFVRSTPSKALITTLIGQKASRHVQSNLGVLKYPVLTPEEWRVHLDCLKEKEEESDEE